MVSMPTDVLYNGSKRLNTLKQQRMNNRIAELGVAESENTIEESITQIYVQILYAAEAVKVNEATLDVSRAGMRTGTRPACSGKHAERPRPTGSAGQHRQISIGNGTSYPARLQTATETTPRTGRRKGDDALHPHTRR